MTRMTKDQRDKLLARKAQIEAQIRDIDAREQARRRKDDTRAKIIFGALAMEHAATNPDSEFASIMSRLLHRYVRRPADRKLMGLPERAPDSSNNNEKDGTLPETARVAESA